jgi:hypothetical protein
MAQDGSWTSGKHRRHPPRLATQQRVPNRVDTTVDRVEGTTTKPCLDLIARYPSIQKLPASDDTMLALSQPRNHEINGRRKIRATLGAYMTHNVTRVRIPEDRVCIGLNAAAAWRVRGALKRVFLQRKRGSSPPVPPLALIP